MVLLALVFVPVLYPSTNGASTDILSIQGNNSSSSLASRTSDAINETSSSSASSLLSVAPLVVESVRTYSSGLKQQTVEPVGRLQLANDNSSTAPGFSSADLSLINRTAISQVRFIESLQLTNGAIEESTQNPVVYTRDLSLAALALARSGSVQSAGRSIEFLLSLHQNSSSYTGPGGTHYSSPSAWEQVYSTVGAPLDPSLRGEDQGMALLAISSYIQATHNTSMALESWVKIENSANYIVYLQNTPESGELNHVGLYRHGDNWHDTRQENMVNGSSPIYWPYWPEYYQWEEENMRMILGMRGAIWLAQDLGFSADVRAWNTSVSAALAGLDNEWMYSKYEAYDYFGSVLWGLQNNTQAAREMLASMPQGFFTSSYGVKDLPWLDLTAASDTIDYMLCLARVQNYTGASLLLHTLTTRFENPQGGFYDTINLQNVSPSPVSMVYSSARFVYFSSVVFNSEGPAPS